MTMTMYTRTLGKNLALVPVCGVYTILRGTPSRAHIHKVYHLIFVTEGTGTMTKGDRVIPLNKRDVLIINPDEPHVFAPVGEARLVYFSINFYLLDIAGAAGFAQLEQNLGNIDFYESCAVTVPFQALFGVATENDLVRYQPEWWDDIYRCVTEVDEYYARYLAHAPLSRDEYLVSLYSLVNFMAGRLFFLAELFARSGSAEFTSKQRRLVQSIIDYIAANHARPLSLADMAAQLSYSPVHLCRFFKEKTGYTISGYLNHYRIERACELLRTNTTSIGRIADLLGFSSPQHFSKNFKMAIGLSPKAYRLHMG